MAENRPEYEMQEEAEDDSDDFYDFEDDDPLVVNFLRRNDGAGDGDYLEASLQLWDRELQRHRQVAGHHQINQVLNRMAPNGLNNMGPGEEDHDSRSPFVLRDHLDYICTDVLWTTLMHPLQHAGVLMQLGFEPFPGEIVRLGFFGSRIFLPGAQHLIAYIHQSDGFFGLFRGLQASIAEHIASYTVEAILDELGPRTCQLNRLTDTTVKDVSWNVLVRGIRLTLNLVVTQPFTVVFTRQIAQFIGCESVYTTMGQTAIKIFTEEGLAAFYAGFMPRLLRNMGTMVITTVATTIFLHYGPQNYSLRALNEIVVNISTSYLLHPLSVVGTCMDVQGSPLAAAMPSQMPHYEDWIKCFMDIFERRGFYHRGGALFCRKVPAKKLHDLAALQN